MLWHSYQPDPDVDRDEEKLIGIYSTEDKAKEAIERLRTRPGFRESPDCFEIHPQRVGATSWDEGFVRVRETRSQKEHRKRYSLMAWLGQIDDADVPSVSALAVTE